MGRIIVEGLHVLLQTSVVQPPCLAVWPQPINVYKLQSRLLGLNDPLLELLPIIEECVLKDFIGICLINFWLIINHLFGRRCNKVLNEGMRFLGFPCSFGMDLGKTIDHTIAGDIMFL